VYFVRYTIALSVVLILLLALVNYNVGLGLRQRTMVISPLLSLFVAAWAYRVRQTVDKGRDVLRAVSTHQPDEKRHTNVLGARAP
jgi:hypothetical protein